MDSNQCDEQLDSSAQQSKNRAKNQKKKEKKKQQRQQMQDVIAEVEQEVKQQEVVANADDPEFQSELVWCIKQIRLGQKNRVSPEQAQEMVSALTMLESESVPIVKKRQFMRTIFGDYRALMKRIK